MKGGHKNNRGKPKKKKMEDDDNEHKQDDKNYDGDNDVKKGILKSLTSYARHTTTTVETSNIFSYLNPSRTKARPVIATIKNNLACICYAM